MKKQVMIRAWEIARIGKAEHGGKVSEYLAESMKIAWKQIREDKAEKVMQVVTCFETKVTDLTMIDNGKVWRTVKDLNPDVVMETMADYASGFGYKAMDYYFVIDGKRAFRGRRVATVRSAA